MGGLPKPRPSKDLQVANERRIARRAYGCIGRSDRAQSGVEYENAPSVKTDERRGNLGDDSLEGLTG